MHSAAYTPSKIMLESGGKINAPSVVRWHFSMVPGPHTPSKTSGVTTMVHRFSRLPCAQGLCASKPQWPTVGCPKCIDPRELDLLSHKVHRNWTCYPIKCIETGLVIPASASKLDLLSHVIPSSASKLDLLSHQVHRNWTCYPIKCIETGQLSHQVHRNWTVIPSSAS